MTSAELCSVKLASGVVLSEWETCIHGVTVIYYESSSNWLWTCTVTATKKIHKSIVDALGQFQGCEYVLLREYNQGKIIFSVSPL